MKVRETTTLAELEVFLLAFGLRFFCDFERDGVRRVAHIEDADGISAMGYGSTIAEALRSARDAYLLDKGRSLCPTLP